MSTHSSLTSDTSRHSNMAVDALSRVCPIITNSPESSWLSDYKADPVTRVELVAPDGQLAPPPDQLQTRSRFASRPNDCSRVPCIRSHPQLQFACVVRTRWLSQNASPCRTTLHFPRHYHGHRKVCLVLRHLSTHQVRAWTLQRSSRVHRASTPPLAVRQHRLGPSSPSPTAP